jgi:cold shock CspA family protein/ribosome-associated translation inhibitor RaiA
VDLPIQITYRGMGSSEALEARIRERAEELTRFCDRITRCHVVVESGPRHHQKGQVYHIRVNLSVPGSEIVVNRNPSEHHAHEDVDVAIRDAFDAVRRQLEDHVRRARGQDKAHEIPEHGRVARLYPAEDYGFIAAADGQEIYMHRNSVVGGAFDALHIGDEVRFVAQASESEKGLQASTVIPVGKHNPAPSST